MKADSFTEVQVAAGLGVGSRSSPATPAAASSPKSAKVSAASASTAPSWSAPSKTPQR